MSYTALFAQPYVKQHHCVKSTPYLLPQTSDFSLVPDVLERFAVDMDRIGKVSVYSGLCM